MAMTKAEQVKMKALEEALRIAKALRWSNRPEPVKLLPPLLQEGRVLSMDGISMPTVAPTIVPSAMVPSTL